MLLCVDIGNTNITLGIFDRDNLLETLRLASDRELTQEEYEVLLHNLLKKYDINNCIIASVAQELDKVIKRSIDNIFHINSIIMNNKLNYGISVNIKNPNEAGADRIVNALAACKLYSNPAIIVDLGTATTFDIINKQGEFIGGVIMPGLNLQLKSLNAYTSKLPRVEVGKSNSAIGNCTTRAILSGVIRGSACAIEGLIKQCEAELGGKATIIATGGYSTLISDYMNKKFDFVNPYLTLEGLKYLFELNCQSIQEK